MRIVGIWLCLVLVPVVGSLLAAETSELSHLPMRPLPSSATQRLSAAAPAEGGKVLKITPDDDFESAIYDLAPGDVLELSGGIYFGRWLAEISGTVDKPITIRGADQQVVIFDGSIPEFQLAPEKAWKPVGPDLYRSTETYPEFQAVLDGTNVLGHFEDSMIPLHGYRFLKDLTSSNEYLAEVDAEKTSEGNGVYCGPGLFYESKTGHVFCRLAHTRQPALKGDNYSGPTDPRKLKLLVAGSNDQSVLTLKNCQHVRLENLIFRGSRDATLLVEDCADIRLENVTSYGGSSALKVETTHGLRARHCAFRGIAAPWTWRGSLKYRAIEARIVAASSWEPRAKDSRHLEFDLCEFTDCVDGVFIGNVRGVRISRCYLDNISDDGLFVTAGTGYDGTTRGGDIVVENSLLSRCLTTFAFGVGHGRQRATANGKQLGAGLIVRNNVFDFRRPVHYEQPGPDATEITSFGRLAGDHGSPGWEPLEFAHNTVINGDAPWRSYYAGGLASGMGAGTRRRLFNNVFVTVRGEPGQVLPDVTADFVADGNLHWTLDAAARKPEAFLARFRTSPAFDASQGKYAAGWTKHDRMADPEFANIPADWTQPLDPLPSTNSAAASGAVASPLLKSGSSDIKSVGAVPVGSRLWRVGQRGRLSVGGHTDAEFLARQCVPVPASHEDIFPASKDRIPGVASRVLIMQGYPAFDAPLYRYAFEAQNADVTLVEKHWYDVESYRDFDVVVITGDLARAKIEPNRYSFVELSEVQHFLQNGGTLLITRSNRNLFATEEGRAWLKSVAGFAPRPKEFSLKLLEPEHAWVTHLQAAEAPSWLQEKSFDPMSLNQGTNVIGSADGLSVLASFSIGKGRLIFVGWDIASALPHGRLASSVKQEEIYESQYRILEAMARDISRWKAMP